MKVTPIKETNAYLETGLQIEPLLNIMREMPPEDATDFVRAVNLALEHILERREYGYFGNSIRLSNLIGGYFVTVVKGVPAPGRGPMT